MKKIIVGTAAAALLASSVYAGSLVEPQMEPMVAPMEETQTSSSGGLIVPLLALLAIGLLVSNSSSGSSS